MANYVDANFTKKHLTDGKAKVINVLSKESYAEKHVPGSINVPEDDPDFASRIQEAVPDKSTTLIVHCSGMDCQTSTRAARKLESLGYKDVHDFKAGLQGWEQAGNTFATGPAQTPAATTPDAGVGRPPRPGREASSHREEKRATETPKL